jgi:hypothetical protein
MHENPYSTSIPDSGPPAARQPPISSPGSPPAAVIT